MECPVSLPTTLLRRCAAALLAVSFTALTPAFALPVMDLHAEDLLPMAAELKKSLHLNANQQTLWQQTESKTRQLLRERQSRRERLQAASRTGLEGANVELRDLNGALDAETAACAAEEQQLRQWWLNVNDALDEGQRKQVVQLLGEQLQRMPDNGGHGAAPRVREGGEGGEGGRGGHRKPGGGMPGG